MIIGFKKFNTSVRPKKPSRLWHALQGLVSLFLIAPVKGKIIKENCEGLKAPYLVLANHGSLVDFAMAIKATWPNPSNWVASIEEFNGREYMFREMGVIYKRKFTNDVTVVRHVLHALVKNKRNVIIYPEARFSLVGVNEKIDNAIGKLVKIAKCPVVIFLKQGNFLRSPQWNKHPYRDVKVSGRFIQIVTKEEALTLSADEIQKRIDQTFVYDEYKWQYENKIHIKCKQRAENIHRVLYQCPHCKTEFQTYSKGNKIWCQHCGKVWEMDTLGRLHCENGEDIFNHVPDWYNWQRENVRKEIESGNYKFEDTARLELLVSSWHKFKALGNIKLTHDYNGFTMEGEIDGKPFTFNRAPETMSSCHIEYDYKGRGDAIDLCTMEDTYFVFPQTATNCLTKLHFATEEMHNYIARQHNKA